jgi:hypothetical protein
MGAAEDEDQSSKLKAQKKLQTRSSNFHCAVAREIGTLFLELGISF